MRLLKLLFATVAISLFLASSATAAPTVNQKCEALDGGANNALLAQTFTVGVSGQLVGVDVSTFVVGGRLSARQR